MVEYPGLRLVEEEGGRVLCAIEPAAQRPRLDADALRSLLEGAGYGGWFLLEEGLAAVLEQYARPDAQCALPVAERRDASFSIEIAPDALSVSVSLVPARGGRMVSPDEVLVALEAAGVVFGIDPSAVALLCQNAVPQRVVVAHGKAAERGEDTRFELLVAESRDRTPHVDAHGLIDFRALGDIPTVTAGQPLMRRIPPTPGVAGCTVRGEPLDAVSGRDEPWAADLPGARLAEDDANLLLAAVNGQPVRRGNGVMVEQVLRVANVDMTTGHISFDGTVHVDGEVLPGMKIHATGDIVVAGVVDAGELDAGGDIRIGGGIIAQARVRAGGSVEARFVENAHIYAGTTITIDDMALQSDLQAINQIIVGAKSGGRGRLVGGSARAMLLIQAPLVGAAAAGVTCIQLGVNPVLEAKYQEVLHRIEKQKEEEANLEKLVKYLSVHGNKGDVLERARASWQHAIQAWGSLLPERDALEKELELIAGARLVVGTGVGGPLDITFGKKKMLVNKTLEAGTFLLDGEHIVFTTQNMPPAKE